VGSFAINDALLKHAVYNKAELAYIFVLGSKLNSFHSSDVPSHIKHIMATTTITETASQAPIVQDSSKYDFANLEPYVHPPATKEDLPWAELVTLDLEDYNRPGGKERLSKQLEHAVHHVGFVRVPLFIHHRVANADSTLVLRQELRPHARAGGPSIHPSKALLQVADL
jgi:hypothetical protein